MYTDVMGKLDPRTGKVTEFPSPYGERGTRDMGGCEGPDLVRRTAVFQGRLRPVRTEAEKAAALSR